MKEKENIVSTRSLFVLVLALGVFVALGAVDALAGFVRGEEENIKVTIEDVMPADGITLPIVWGDIGVRMTESGVIDEPLFKMLYDRRGGLSEDARELLYGKHNTSIHITRENAGELLNLLWAFGLANKNEILETGPMVDERYGGAGNFASTGGWTLSVGDSMNHYSAHSFVELTSEQQNLVEKVSQNIYRPCCGNATNFPDCNHGMAMLGLLELLAANGVSEEEMYEVALAVNSYWFPSTYVTIAKLFAAQGVAWRDVEPTVVLGYDYSSAEGFSKVLSQVEPANGQGGGSCSI